MPALVTLGAAPACAGTDPAGTMTVTTGAGDSAVGALGLDGIVTGGGWIVTARVTLATSSASDTAATSWLFSHAQDTPSRRRVRKPAYTPSRPYDAEPLAATIRATASPTSAGAAPTVSTGTALAVHRSA